MVKYLVGRGLPFTIDHCHGCKGIWLDGNEWEALKKRNLHDDLNLMFTSFWQKEAQREARKKKMEEIYVDRFGTLISNIPGEAVEPGVRIKVGGTEIGLLSRTFGAVGRGALVALVGSDGTVEVAVRDGSAARLLGVGVGAEVRA